MITWENYEEYMVMHADGELSPEQEQALMSFLYEHPDLQADLTAFTMTKMVPDTTETYALKDALLRPEIASKPVVMAFPLWRRYAVAAAVVAMLAVPGYRYMMQPTAGDMQGHNMIADATMPGTIAVPVQSAPAVTVPVLPVQEKSVATQSPVIAAVATLPAAGSRPVRGTRTAKSVGVGATVAYYVPADNNAGSSIEGVVAAETISPLAVVAVHPIETEEKKFVAVVTNTLPLAIEYTESDNESNTVGTLLDKLPMSDTRRNGMKSFAAEVATGYSRVTNVTQEIAQAGIAFRIGKKQLKLSF